MTQLVRSVEQCSTTYFKYCYTLVPILAGDAVFNDLAIDTPANQYYFPAFCQNTDLSWYKTIESTNIIIHDWPEMATVRKQTVGFRYEGDLEYVVPTINAFNEVMVDGQDDFELVDLETGETPAGQDKYIDLTNYNPAHDPTCYEGITCLLT